MISFAPKVAYQFMSSDFTVAGGVPILVYGYTCSHTSGGNFTLSDIDGNEISRIKTLIGTTLSMNIPFVAPNGLKITNGSGTGFFTVYYGVSG